MNYIGRPGAVTGPGVPHAWSMRLAFFFSLLASGCYLSHPIPGDAPLGDAPDAPDAPPPIDAPLACLPADACHPATTLRDGVCAPPPRALDDGFEDAPVSFGNPVGAVLSCWTVVLGDADIVSGGAGFLGPSDTGVNALDLNGWTSGAIERDVRVVTGRTYHLRFAFTRNPQMVDPEATGTLTIDGRRIIELRAAVANTASDLMWSYFEVDLVAASPRMTIRFTSTNPGDGGLYLDSVTLDEVL